MKKIILLIILIITIVISSKVKAYTEYKIGDIVSYNDMEFYVIKNSDVKENSVTMLKAEPLTVEEVNLYGGVGTEYNHVNMYSEASYEPWYQTAHDQKGYGGMVYYSSSTCGYYSWSSECINLNVYENSNIKYVVDAWAQDKILSGLKEARLIKLDDLTELIEIRKGWDSGGEYEYMNYKYEWLYGDYWYWTMIPRHLEPDNNNFVYIVDKDGRLFTPGNVTGYSETLVRPVIVLNKTALGDIDESIIDNDSNENIDIDIQKEDNSLTVIKDNNKQESIIKVNVANTYLKQSIIVIIMGFIIAGISVFIYYKVSNKKK